MKTLIVSAHCLLILSGTVLAQQPREKPAELKVLGHYVGDWTSEVTSKPAVWTPEEKKYNTSNHAEFVLDGWFLNHIEVNHVVGDSDKVTKALMISTYDPQAKEYVTWFFQSSGMIGHSTGTWSPRDKSLQFTPTELPPNATCKHTESFPNESTITGSLLFTGNDGKTLFDMVWTRKRQPGVTGQPTQKQWDEIGKPIQPIPDEVKKLEPFVGEWDSEFIQRPSVASPKGSTSTGTMTGQWILDGRQWDVFWRERAVTAMVDNLFAFETIILVRRKAGQLRQFSSHRLLPCPHVDSIASMEDPLPQMRRRSHSPNSQCSRSCSMYTVQNR